MVRQMLLAAVGLATILNFDFLQQVNVTAYADNREHRYREHTKMQVPRTNNSEVFVHEA